MKFLKATGRFVLRYPLLILFALFIFGLTAIDIIKPDKSFSDLENRYLEQNPKFSLKAYFSNQYTPKYETYINDQFLLRDNWISLKSRAEYALGKQENNGVVYGEDRYMFEKYKTPDTERLETNTRFVNEFAAMYPDREITFSIIPNSYMILQDKVPAGLNNVDQFAMTDEIYENITEENVSTFDFRDALLAHKDEYIFYRTDHHWTTLGAYYAYSAYMQHLAMEPVALDELEKHEVQDFYGTYFSKCKLFNAVPDVITYYDVHPTETLIDYQPVDGIYDYSKLETRDKYAMFLRGNNGVMKIASDNNRYHKDGETSRILVIKDSYANSFVPYLTYNFDEVWVVDLRNMSQKMKDFMAEQEFDEILLMYNFMNFESDTYISKLRY